MVRAFCPGARGETEADRGGATCEGHNLSPPGLSEQDITHGAAKQPLPLTDLDLKSKVKPLAASVSGEDPPPGPQMPRGVGACGISRISLEKAHLLPCGKAPPLSSGRLQESRP